LIRQLLSDGYYPKSGNTSPLVDFEEYEVVQDSRPFWTLSSHPTAYSLLDADVSVGALSQNTVSVPGGDFECSMLQPWYPRVGKVFYYLMVKSPSCAVPLALFITSPIQSEEFCFGGPSFVSIFEGYRMWSKDKSFFIADQRGHIWGQFLAESHHPARQQGSKGTIHVRSDLEVAKKCELLAVLFAVSTLHHRHLLDTTGF
jgi:hypothetical protein